MRGSRRAVIGCNRVFSSFTPYLPIPQQFGRARVKLPGEGSTTLQTGLLVGHKVKKKTWKSWARSRIRLIVLLPRPAAHSGKLVHGLERPVKHIL